MNKETRSLGEIIGDKTDRELIEEIIKQNIVIHGKIVSTRKMVGFLFVLGILELIGAALFILSVANTR